MKINNLQEIVVQNPNKFNKSLRKGNTVPGDEFGKAGFCCLCLKKIEVEHDIVNYQNRGLCYLPKLKAEADNTDTRF